MNQNISSGNLSITGATVGQENTSAQPDFFHRKLGQLDHLSYIRSNWIKAMCGDVIQTLFTMSDLPEDHPLHLDPVLARRAADVLGTIVSTVNADPPRLLNEDGEAVTFTWALGPAKRYVSIDAESVELMDRDLVTKVRETLSLGSPETLDIDGLVAAWSGLVNNTTKTL